MLGGNIYELDNTITGFGQDLILGSIYIPPENSRFYSPDELNILEDELSSYCNNNKYVFLAGDANSRVGTLKDFILPDPHTNKLFGIDVELENDLYKHTLLENLSVPLHRNSLDKRTNTHGFLLLDMCKNNNMFIINGRLFKDETIGAFTFRDKSVIDYVLATAESFNFITDFKI